MAGRTITIEEGEDQPDIHLHAGEQGLWVARMAATLGAGVILCSALGGESGSVLRALIESEHLTLPSGSVRRANGIYIHDRRRGERVEVASTRARPLRRQGLDELYGIALTTALTADVVLLTGPNPADAIDASLYRRLATTCGTRGKPSPLRQTRS